MAREFLGTGWRFPILPDESGGLGYEAGEANVEQSLRVLLMTRLGARVMRPRFGNEAPRLVFAPGSEQYLRLIERSIHEAVRDWEPRVELEQVRAETDAEDETRVTVSIDYRVRPTNSRFNLVFPFYLDSVEVL
ncbi:MAG: GPW/gp25 family protein [bacterium]|nr:GPW/gp25 family protein [bacterium]